MKKAVFVDRDGTIVKEKEYIKDASSLELLPGVAQTINGFHMLGFLVILVTNQSAVGRGYITTEKLLQIHKRLKDLLSQANSFLDAIYVCPHHPDDDCNCRKPKPGLIKKACRDFDIDKTESYIIGDQSSDIELGRREKICSILVLTGFGKKTLNESSPDYVVDDILKAGRLISRIEKNRIKKGK
ncbi:HAD family hydrolase [candidate division WOR-3 bacterium]|nr:HAD family hydrolase [candidate division WOR-3 bacterium]